MGDGGRTTRGDMLEALSGGDWMRKQLYQRLAACLRSMRPLCLPKEEEDELAWRLVNAVWDWLMGNAQLMILVGRYADPALTNRPDVSELAGKE